MKKLLLVFFIFYCLYTEAQISGEITYGENLMHIAIDTSKIEKKQVKAIIMQQMQSIKKALSGDQELYTLNFNSTESVFKPLPIMENDANPNLKRAISQGVYYTNLSICNNFHQIYIFGDTYRIKRNAGRFDWKITNITKKIQGYSCSLATTEIKIKSGTIIKIEAWFTSEIPFSFGPKGYGGLPGLILAIEERGHYFYAKSIRLDKKNVDIERPSKGKLISETELNKMIEKAMGK